MKNIYGLEFDDSLILKKSLEKKKKTKRNIVDGACDIQNTGACDCSDCHIHTNKSKSINDLATCD